MGNNLKYKDMNSSVLFFRGSVNSCYYKFNGKTFEANPITINKLKEELSAPFKVKFHGLSRAQVGKVIGYLLDNTMDVKIKKINTKENNNIYIMKFEALFIRQKKYIDTYKVPNVSSLYNKTINCNPYLYTDINSKKVLIEVPKDYAKDNVGDYYFLSSDLDVSEREFFDSKYAKLQYDYIYKIEKKLSDKKLLKKSL